MVCDNPPLPVKREAQSKNNRDQLIEKLKESRCIGVRLDKLTVLRTVN